MIAWVETLKQKFTGRYPDHARTAQRAVAQAVALKAGAHSMKERGKLVGLTPDMLREEYKRHTAFFAGTVDSLIVLRATVKMTANPPEWAAAWVLPNVARESQDKTGSRPLRGPRVSGSRPLRGPGTHRT